jgi:HPt (histidine-containing phosphotransfer) domain-containing protein
LAQDAALVLDEKEILRAFAGHRELIREIGGMALDECPKLMQEIARALEHGEALVLANAAHRMKGTVAQFRPALLLPILTKMEKSGRGNRLADVAESMPELRAELERFMNALRTWIESCCAEKT